MKLWYGTRELRAVVTALCRSPADVGLFEVGPHADGLPVQLVRFLQPRVIGSDQVC